MRGRVAGGIAVAAAAAAALAPLPPAWIESHYSRGFYPAFQRALTRASNAVPIAAFDVLVVAAACAVPLGVVVAMRAPKGGRLRLAGRLAWRGVVAAALVYLAFLVAWGLNYRREPVESRLDFDERRVTAEAVVGLNDAAVAELGRLRPLLPEQYAEWPTAAAVARALAGALEQGSRLLALPAPITPGRPKRSILDPFFTRAGVSGFTDPFFLETLLPSNLLPFELPSVVAHEWGHLAGLARESEASLFAAVVCLHGDETAQYSAWLEVFAGTLIARDAEGRREARGRLPAAVRADLDAMAARSARDEVRLVRRAAWRAYDRYLRSQRVASGAADYGGVVRLLAGLRFESGQPAAARPER
ncbi:MAG TPA: DUF3810 family protein [Vicinamibacterales bacterium]|nr:DUF3810 family protein [Vicinamibacterales bacterium]